MFSQPLGEKIIFLEFSGLGMQMESKKNTVSIATPKLCVEIVLFMDWDWFYLTRLSCYSWFGKISLTWSSELGKKLCLFLFLVKGQRVNVDQVNIDRRPFVGASGRLGDLSRCIGQPRPHKALWSSLCWIITCLYRIQNTRSGKLNGSTSFTIYNMHSINFRIQV